MWQLFKSFVFLYFLQTFFFVLFRRKNSAWKTSSSVISCVESKQSHTYLEKTFFSVVQLFSQQWNQYKILSFHQSQSIEGTNSTRNTHRIEVKENTKYLLVGYHSRPLLDLLYLVANFECSIFVIHILFYLPGMKKLLPLFGLIPAKEVTQSGRSNEDYFMEVLEKSSRPILLLPGGAMECLKDYDQLYELQWKKEMGFARILRNYYLKEPAPGKEKLRIKIIPFYSRHCEFLFFSTSWWYTQTGRTVRSLMASFQESYLENIALLPIILLVLLFSFGFFPLSLPIPVETYFGHELEFDASLDASTEAFTSRIRCNLEELMTRVNSEAFHAEEPATLQQQDPQVPPQTPTQQRARKDPIPTFEELMRRHSPLYSSEVSFPQKAYLLSLGLFALISTTLVHLVGILTLLLMFVLLKLLTPLFLRYSHRILSKVRKQKIS